MIKSESVHKSVLLKESIEGLNLKKDGVVLDGTFGGGGHSSEICRGYPGIKIIAVDKDKGALEKSKIKFKNLPCTISFVNANFRDIPKIIREEKVEAIDAILLDIGISSDQLENSGRGFSFTKDEPLMMTMKDNPKEEDLTAEEIVNTWSKENLADIIYGYGEERFARRIASGIVEARKKGKIKSTFELVEIIKGSIPKSAQRGRINPATKTFQALRIAVNDELTSLQIALKNGFEALRKGGRIAVITFHSLEDRIVKRFYKGKVDQGEGKLINKKPILAGSAERGENPRARSAKLRIIEKII